MAVPAHVRPDRMEQGKRQVSSYITSMRTSYRPSQGSCGNHSPWTYVHAGRVPRWEGCTSSSCFGESAEDYVVGRGPVSILARWPSYTGSCAKMSPPLITTKSEQFYEVFGRGSKSPFAPSVCMLTPLPNLSTGTMARDARKSARRCRSDDVLTRKIRRGFRGCWDKA